MTTLLSIFLKYVVPVLGVIALLFGVYEYGHSKGYDTGYQAAWDKQQATIQGIVDVQNAQTKVQNAQIDSLVKKSQQDTLDLAAANMNANLARGTVITTYIQANPVVSKSCGWDLPTVDAINAIVTSDPVNKAANTTPIPASGVTAK